MSLTISGDHISGDNTTHTAHPVPGHPNAWEVSWLPGRLVSRTTAISAMLLADVAGARTPQAGDRLWPHVEGWAAEIGLTAPEALARATEPTGRVSAEKDDAAHSEPEAEP